MANGAAPGGGPTPLPGWLGPIVQITTQLGVPTVFAGVLLWFVLFRVGGTLQTIEKAEDERTRIVAAMQDTLVAALDRQADRFASAIQENIKENERMADLAHQERLLLLDKFQLKKGKSEDQ